MKKHAFVCSLSLFLLSTLLVGIFIPLCCAQQDVLASEGEASLQSWLTYAESYVTEDGKITSSFAVQNSLRGTALLGQLVIGIHIGLVDSPSLLLLNRIADYVNTHISQNSLDLTASSVTNDEVLTMGAVTDFLVGHYALTNSAQSRENLLQVTDYLMQQLGWSPLTSRLFVLTNVLRIDQLTGGSILKQDVEEAISDLLDHQLEFIDFSLLNQVNIPISLNVLSALYSAAIQAQVSVPSEVIALWEVYSNYTLTDLSTMHVTPTDYSFDLQYLSGLVEALEVSSDPQILRAAQTLAVDLLSIWQSGDRLIRQPFSPFDVYPYDPALNYSQIIQDFQDGIIIWKVDLKLASLVDRLAIHSQSNASLAEEFRSSSNFALNKVVQGDYFFLFESGTLPTEGFVDRLESAAFISEWLARHRLQEQVPFELGALQPLNVPVSLIASVAILITLGLLHNRGVLFPRKEDD